MSIRQRIEDAAGEYDKWPKSMKEAFRLSTVVDRIPPTLQHGVALLGEIDRLESLLTAATERAEKAESQRDRMRVALERVVASDTGEWFDAIRDKFVYCGKCQDKEYEASKALEEVGDEREDVGRGRT